MRRLLSVILYVIAGMFLAGEMMMAFAGEGLVGDAGFVVKLAMIGIMAAFALVPLGLGTLISPGRRVREVGITLFTAAVFTAVEVFMIAFLVLMPDTTALFPPNAVEPFDAMGQGLTNMVAIGALGWWMMTQERRTASEA